MLCHKRIFDQIVTCQPQEEMGSWDIPTQRETLPEES